MSSLKVLIADDNQLARLGVQTLLETDPDIQVVGVAPDGPAAIEACSRLHPDVVVLDLKMPGLDGAQVTQALRRTHPDVRILILSQLDGDSAIQTALAAGAAGYVTKDMAGDEIVRAVHEVAAGRRFLPEGIRARLDEGEGERPLSGREREVLQLVFKGLSNREISEVLAISERTVNIHLHNLFRKLGVSSRVEAVSVAIERGLLLGL